MIRDTRKINIETEFFQDDQFYSPKMHQDTLQTNLLTKDKAAIFLYNILDTLRLQKVINVFGILINKSRSRIRKYSSREIFFSNKQHTMKPPSVINHNQNNNFSPNQEVDYEPRVLKNRTLARNEKRTLSLNSKNEKKSSYLRQSRKRILQSISKTLYQQPIENMHDIQKNNILITKKLQVQPKQNNKTMFENQKSQNLQIKNKLLKLQRLMKNIRQQKDKQEPIIVHQKRVVAELPKKQKNNKQMVDFMQQLKSLRTQIHEIKQINEQILHHSRERSVKSSKIAKSQNHSLHLQSLPYKNIKRSQFIEDNLNKQIKQRSPKYARHDQNENQRRQQNPRKSLTSEKIEKNLRKKMTINNQTSLSILPQKSKEIKKDMDKDTVENKISQQSANKNTNPSKNNKNNSTSWKQGYERIDGLNQDKTKQRFIKKTQDFYGANQQIYRQNSNNIKKQDEQTDLNYIRSQLQSINFDTFNSNNYDKSKNNYQINGKMHENLNSNVNNLVALKNYESTGQNNRKKQQSRNEYKLSPWYREYGSPVFNATTTINNNFSKKQSQNMNIVPKINYNSNINTNMNSQNSNIVNPIRSNRETVSFSADNDNYVKQTNRTNKLQGLTLYNLNEITDKVSYSNFNSARTSNYSKQQQIGSGKEYHKYPNYNYNYNDQSHRRDYQNYDKDYYQDIDYIKTKDLGKDKPYNYNTYNTYQTYDYNNNNNKQSNEYGHKSNSDYTNPDLLKSLNIGPFPKIDTSVTVNKNSNAWYDQNNNSKNSKDILGSFKTISDHNSYNSYTYSNNSSAPTSMAKLQQQYQQVINDSPTKNKYVSYQTYQTPYLKYEKNQQKSQVNNGQHENQYEYQKSYGTNKFNRVIDDGGIEGSYTKNKGQYGGYSFQQIYEDYAKSK